MTLALAGIAAIAAGAAMAAAAIARSEAPIERRRLKVAVCAALAVYAVAMGVLAVRLDAPPRPAIETAGAAR
ncbi:hypothetical protein [Blastochloris tepida]|uniref:Uncharacterized protein n=1 Tax=Blastochloris tepida TaxID=2233851 RepID=A0A348FYK8_9HYPH|nr:hypothetical protein [Blastochloris tepida]BBF92391.1 hypothetical protein BLTE_10760 [Blastochloris tepida]